MQTTSLTIKGEFFRSSYSVYVVEIKLAEDSKTNTHYYIGQTGDSNYLTARSPFYRMGGHFEYRKSTQNQIFKGLCANIESLGNTADIRAQRAALEKLLIQGEITYHVFQLHDFSYADDNREEHRRKRRSTLVVETALLQKFARKYGERLLNKRTTSLNQAPNEEEKKFVEDILLDLAEKGVKV